MNLRVTRPEGTKESRMDVHQNARLTYACRVLLVQRVQAGRPKIQVARELGVSIKTVEKWLQRFAQGGPEALRDRSSRPHRSPQATAEVLRTAVVALRRQHLTLVRKLPRQGHSVNMGCPAGLSLGIQD